VGGWIPLIVVASTVFLSLSIAACRKRRFGHFVVPVIGLPIAAMVLASHPEPGDTMGLGPILMGAFIGFVTLVVWLIALIVAVVRPPRKRGEAALPVERRRRSTRRAPPPPPPPPEPADLDKAATA
jgi:hypothetical protein